MITSHSFKGPWRLPFQSVAQVDQKQVVYQSLQYMAKLPRVFLFLEDVDRLVTKHTGYTMQV